MSFFQRRHRRRVTTSRREFGPLLVLVVSSIRPWGWGSPRRRRRCNGDHPGREHSYLIALERRFGGRGVSRWSFRLPLRVVVAVSRGCAERRRSTQRVKVVLKMKKEKGGRFSSGEKDAQKRHKKHLLLLLLPLRPPPPFARARREKRRRRLLTTTFDDDDAS